MPENVRTALAGVTDASVPSARGKVPADAAAYPEAARLRGFIDHLLMHTASTGAEIEILDRAAALWKSGRSIYDAAGGIRTAVEGAFADPTALDAAPTFKRRDGGDPGSLMVGANN